MIPKQAFFTWVGDDELPWLRQLAIDSFKSHNPDWDVALLRVPREARLLSAQATDIFRYHHLAERGGFYFDTDIVFFRPVPDLLLDAQLVVTIDKAPFNYDPAVDQLNPTIEGMPGFNNLAMMGCAKGQQFFKDAYNYALDSYEVMKADNSRKLENKQIFGTEMLNRMLYGKTEQQIAEMYPGFFNLALDVVLPVMWDKAYTLFNGTPFEPGPSTIGVHWYGGTADAKRYCHTLCLDTYQRRPCYLTEAIKAALA